MKSVKVIHKYFSENLWFAKLAYITAGMGIGILIAYPVVGEHPVRWGVGLLLVSALLHIVPLLQNKKK